MSFQQNLPVAVVGGDSIKWPLSHRLPTTRAQRRQGSVTGRPEIVGQNACHGRRLLEIIKIDELIARNGPKRF